MENDKQEKNSSGAYKASNKKGLIAFIKFSAIPVLGGFFLSIVVATILNMFVEPSEGMSYIATISLVICGLLLYKKSVNERNSYLKLFQATYQPKHAVYPRELASIYTVDASNDIWFIWKIIWTPQSNPTIEKSRLALTKRFNGLILLMTFFIPIWTVCSHLGLP